MKVGKIILQITAACAALLLSSCEKDDEAKEMKETGYTISVMADSEAKKSAGAASTVVLLNGYVNVTEVELEREEDSTGNESEIDVEGLYRFDLMTGNSTPSFPTSEVAAGTYHELEIEMGDDDEAIVALYAEAEYTDTASITWPIKIEIEDELSLEIEDEVNGIQISSNAIQQLDVIIDMTAILNSIDWSLATVLNGQIVVDSQTNPVIYSQMVNLLNVEIELDDDD